MSAHLPEILAERWPLENKAQVALELRIPADLMHFPGHFPGRPILPGVVQIHWAAGYGRQYLGVDGEFTALENLKFHALIFPDKHVELLLTWERARLAFAYSSGGRKFSAGQLIFGGAA